MNRKSTLLLLVCLFALCRPAVAQVQQNSKRKPYISTGIDGYILSTSVLKKTGADAKMTTPRFTALVNIGVNVNYDFSRRFGVFTGLGIKNIGFIEQFNNPDYTVKRRVYTVGLPLGIKWGDVTYGSYFIAGGGVDFPFNYREKTFERRSDKQKFNEWFSSRTPAVMPYVFIGVHLRPLVAFKLQYYPLNFMNPDFTNAPHTLPAQPYQGYDVKLLMLTAGFDIPYHPKAMIR